MAVDSVWDRYRTPARIADPVSATIAAMAKPPRDADATVQRIPLENREYAAELLSIANRDVRERVQAKRQREAEARTVLQLIEDVAAGIRVFNERGEAAFTDVQIYDRARNIVGGLIGNYSVKGLP